MALGGLIMGLLGRLRRLLGMAQPPHGDAGEADLATRLFGGLAAAMIVRRRHLAGPRGRRAHAPVDRPHGPEARQRLVEELAGGPAPRDPARRDLRRIYRELGGLIAPTWRSERDVLVDRIIALARDERDAASDPLIASGFDQLTDPEVVTAELEVAERVHERLAAEPDA